MGKLADAAGIAQVELTGAAELDPSFSDSCSRVKKKTGSSRILILAAMVSAAHPSEAGICS